MIRLPIALLFFPIFSLLSIILSGCGFLSQSTSAFCFRPGVDCPILVLGQPDGSTNLALRRGAISVPNHVLVAGGKLFVTSSGSSGVYVWNSVPASTAPPDFVLGLPTGETGSSSLECTYVPRPRAENLCAPWAAFSDGTRLFVSDTGYNRVLIWNQLPTQSGTSADLVLGQSNFAGHQAGTGSNRMNGPLGILYAGGKLYVVDGGNHRVLGWNSLPTQIGQPADFVLGQPDFTSNGSGLNSNLFNSPVGLAFDGTRLYLSELENRRILIWNTLPTSNVGANLVLGQANFTSNATAVSATGLSSPLFLSATSNRLYATDAGANRVLVWDPLPTVDQEAAAFAIGQPNLNSGDAALSATGLNSPNGVWASADKVFIADLENTRVLAWSPLPTTNGQAASLVLGQESMTASNGFIQPSDNPIGYFTGSSCVDENRLFVADTLNSRVLIWNAIPQTNQAPADLVLGQPNLVSNLPNNGGISARSLAAPFGVHCKNGKLFVADSENARVLIWDSLPTENFQPADRVLGQPSMTATGTGTSSTKFNLPISPFFDGTHLLVADASNSRVLVWKQLPTTDGQAADLVVGQPDFTTVIQIATQRSLLTSGGIFSDGIRLAISDPVGQRVLIWNQFPSQNYAPADIVLGQSGFTSTSLQTPPDSRTLAQPTSVHMQDGRLIVADTGNHRVLIWDSFPTESFAPASRVIGQSRFDAYLEGDGKGLGPDSVGYNFFLSGAQNHLIISDGTNGRVLLWPWDKIFR